MNYCWIYWPVMQILLSNIRHERIVWVGVCEQRADREQYFWDCESRTPIIFQNIQADGACTANIAVINFRPKCYLGWFERVVLWKVNIQEENTASVRRIRRPHNGRYPFKQVISFWTSRTIAWWVKTDLCQLLLDTATRNILPASDKWS